LKVFSFWRSLASFRVRIALGSKGLAWTPVHVNLLEKENKKEPHARAVVRRVLRDYRAYVGAQGFPPNVFATGYYFSMVAAYLAYGDRWNAAECGHQRSVRLASGGDRKGCGQQSAEWSDRHVHRPWQRSQRHLCRWSEHGGK